MRSLAVDGREHGVAVSMLHPGDTESSQVPGVTGVWKGANFMEREVFDLMGVRFTGHPDLRRILMPEDYEGFPQRRDFPMGGEPVIFTFNEGKLPRRYD